jgi:hypothetical protein
MSIPDPCKQFRKHQIINFLDHLKKDNCSDCQNAVTTIRLESKAGIIARKAFWFLIGGLITPLVLYLIATFWPFWPASHVDVETMKLPLSKGTAAGCVVYTVSISTDRGFDDAYLKMRFPMNISDMKAGIVASDALSTENVMSGSAGEVGRGPNGECKILQTVGQDESGMTVNMIQKAIVIQLAKVQAHMVADALVVGNDDRSPDKSERPVVHEGYFTTSLLGYPAKRSISFCDNPCQVTK